MWISRSLKIFIIGHIVIIPWTPLLWNSRVLIRGLNSFLRNYSKESNRWGSHSLVKHSKSLFWLWIWINMIFKFIFALLLWICPLHDPEKFDSLFKKFPHCLSRFSISPASENSKISFSLHSAPKVGIN